MQQVLGSTELALPELSGSQEEGVTFKESPWLCDAHSAFTEQDS